MHPGGSFVGGFTVGGKELFDFVRRLGRIQGSLFYTGQKTSKEYASMYRRVKKGESADSVAADHKVTPRRIREISRFSEGVRDSEQSSFWVTFAAHSLRLRVIQFTRG